MGGVEITRQNAFRDNFFFVSFIKNFFGDKKVTGVWQLLSHERSFFDFGGAGEK